MSRMLELKSIDAGYGSFQALFDVNLDVRAGEAVGVIGPNGAGKTTLFRLIMGFEQPDSGTIDIGPLVSLPRKFQGYRCLVGYNQ